MKNGDGTGVVAEIPHDEVLTEAIAERKITIAPYYDVKSATCSKCNTDYLACKCTAQFDTEIGIGMRDVELLGYFWTTRPSGQRVELMASAPPEADTGTRIAP
jgi:hypothetical protein